SLSKLGGGIQQIKSDYERAQEAELQSFDGAAIDQISRRLRNQMLIAGSWAADPNVDRTRVAARIHDLQTEMEDLLTVVRHEDSSVRSEDLADIVFDAVAEAQKRYGADKFDSPVVIGTRVPAPMIDARMLSRTISELLKNAKAHLRPGAKVHVGLDYAARDAGITIEIKNSGWGVDTGQKGLLFDGRGLGLTLAHMAATRHGGEIEEVGRPGEDAIFRLKLPILRRSQA
ncbi:MAG TPA: ATP-binding protein, partial [Vicinamibacterales bacterium]